MLINKARLQFKHAKLLVKMTAPSGIVVEIDGDGKVLRSLHSSHYAMFSEVLEYKGNLYLGSFLKPYLLRVALPKS